MKTKKTTEDKIDQEIATFKEVAEKLKPSKDFMRKVLGPPYEKLTGEKYNQIKKMLTMLEPYEVSNNQRTVTSKYKIGKEEYMVHDFSTESDEDIQIERLLPEVEPEAIEEDLPPTLNEAIENGLVPWKDEFRRDFHVAVFRDPKKINKLIFAPQHNTYGVLRDCFSDATDMGQSKIINGEWKSFKIKHGTTDNKKIQWPHVVLTWKAS